MYLLKKGNCLKISEKKEFTKDLSQSLFVQIFQETKIYIYINLYIDIDIYIDIYIYIYIYTVQSLWP